MAILCNLKELSSVFKFVYIRCSFHENVKVQVLWLLPKSTCQKQSIISSVNIAKHKKEGPSRAGTSHVDFRCINRQPLGWWWVWYFFLLCNILVRLLWLKRAVVFIFWFHRYLFFHRFFYSLLQYTCIYYTSYVLYERDWLTQSTGLWGLFWSRLAWSLWIWSSVPQFFVDV